MRRFLQIFPDGILSLRKKEWILWGVSVIVVSLSFLLCPQKELLPLFASLIGVSALIFIGRGLVLGQLLIIAFAVFYGILSIYTKYYGEMITYLGMSAPMALCSMIAWMKNPFEGKKEVKVSSLSRCQIAILCIGAPLVTLLFYFLLRMLGNASLILSTLSVFTSFCAAYLTYCRSPLYAIGYAANDIVLISLWVIAAINTPTATPMIFCFVMFLINDLNGFYSWRKMRKEQNCASQNRNERKKTV